MLAYNYSQTDGLLLKHICKFCNQESPFSVCKECMDEYAKIPSKQCKECKQTMKIYLPAAGKSKFARFDILGGEDVRSDLSKCSDICMTCHDENLSIKIKCDVCNEIYQKYYELIDATYGGKVEKGITIDTKHVCDTCYKTTKLIIANTFYPLVRFYQIIERYTKAILRFKMVNRVWFGNILPEKNKLNSCNQSKLKWNCEICGITNTECLEFQVPFSVIRPLCACDDCFNNIKIIVTESKCTIFNRIDLQKREIRDILYYIPANIFVSFLIVNYFELPQDVKNVIKYFIFHEKDRLLIYSTF